MKKELSSLCVFFFIVICIIIAGIKEILLWLIIATLNVIVYVPLMILHKICGEDEIIKLRK
jgi:hypothetical protein